jgi:hypothetical protein
VVPQDLQLLKEGLFPQFKTWKLSDIAISLSKTSR